MKNQETNRAGSEATDELDQGQAWRKNFSAYVAYTDAELYDQSAACDTYAGAGELFWTYYRMMVAVRA